MRKKFMIYEGYGIRSMPTTSMRRQSLLGVFLAYVASTFWLLECRETLASELGTTTSEVAAATEGKR